MDRNQRVEFRNSLATSLKNGATVSELFNQHALFLSKTPSAIDTLVALCCQIDKNPQRIPTVYQQFCAVLHPDHKFQALYMGFKILLPRYLKTPEYFQSWFENLLSYTGFDEQHKVDVTLRSLFSTPLKLDTARHNDSIRSLEYFLHVTPQAHRRSMETLFMNVALHNAMNSPTLFATLIPQLTNIQSLRKLSLYLKAEPQSLDNKHVISTIFQSLNAKERAVFFVERPQFFAAQHINTAILLPFWRDMMPWVATMIKAPFSQNADVYSLVRRTTPVALRLCIEYFNTQNVTLPDAEAARTLLKSIDPQKMTRPDFLMFEELHTKIQNIVLLNIVGEHTQRGSQRKM